MRIRLYTTSKVYVLRAAYCLRDATLRNARRRLAVKPRRRVTSSGEPRSGGHLGGRRLEEHQHHELLQRHL
eukprot:scaffold83471_cov24-Phaeocystis_antarctica.AAC.1